MASIHTNVLSDAELDYLNNLPEVLTAKASLDARPSGSIYFSVVVTDAISTTLASRFGLHLSAGSSLPMRWIKGDTAPHADVGASAFENTYLMYLNDSPGELIVDSTSYPIQANTGFVFHEGVRHETQGTGSTARLLLGPMNELIEPVGVSTTFYYPSEADAMALTNVITSYGSYIVQDVSGYTSWRIASNSNGPSPKNIVYNVGDTLTGDGITEFYYLYPAGPCFLEGSTILCQVEGVERYVPVEHLQTGTLVKTSLNGYKPVVLLGKGTLRNPGNDARLEGRLYKCSRTKYPQLKHDLYITGGHSILEFPITEKQSAETMKRLGDLYVTDKKYRLMACVDERAEPWNSEGTYTIWSFALENQYDTQNYGVYANGGLLVESCSIRFLKHKSNMSLFK